MCKNRTSNKQQQSEESPIRGNFFEDASVVSDGKDELADVLAQISRVAARLEDESRHNGAVAKLQHYLDALYGNALAAVDREMDHFEGQRNSAHSSTDYAPDSAIDMGEDDQTFVHAKTSNIPIPPTQGNNMTQDEFDEMLDELREMPVRPPTPPQRSAKRSSSTASTTRTEYRPSTSDSLSSIPYGAGTSFLDLEPRSQSPHLRTQSDSAAAPPRPVPTNNHFPHMTGGIIPVRQYGGQTRDSFFENPRPAVPVPRPTTSSSNLTTSSKPNVLRRSSSRLSSALKGLSFSRQRSHSTTSTTSSTGKSSTFSMVQATMPPTPPTPAPASAPNYFHHVHGQQSSASSSPVSTIPRPAPPPLPSSTGGGAGAIFGVPLADSMSVAKGLAGARDGAGSKSTRDYPLSVLRCVYFIQDHGLRAPHIFAQEGDAYRLQRLKSIFSSPETGYGKFLDWNQFTVYEAASLILLFLEELPQPLIPESVAKRWIAMSRQATMSGSCSAISRLDKGIDFWEEALQGVKGAPNRSLFKLLLNLWGEVADSVEWNEMTAERLAEKMVRPLMHLPPTRYGTDYMLGLAFVVRKRSEYNKGMKGERSKAAF